MQYSQHIQRPVVTHRRILWAAGQQGNKDPFTENFFMAGIHTITRQAGRRFFNVCHDLKVKCDVHRHVGISLSAGSCVVGRSGGHKLQGLKLSTVETSSVRRWVGFALVFHIKGTAQHACRLVLALFL